MGEEHDYRMRMIIKQSGAVVSREIVPVTAVGRKGQTADPFDPGRNHSCFYSVFVRLPVGSVIKISNHAKSCHSPQKV
jgi:hypothetical protein